MSAAQLPGRSEEERLQRLQLQDDHIGQVLRESEANGELRSAPSYGKPLALADGFDQTPPELRLGMKILKDAGVVPAEVELMNRIVALQAQADACPDAAAARPLQQQVAELRQALALRLEQLRVNASW